MDNGDIDKPNEYLNDYAYKMSEYASGLKYDVSMCEDVDYEGLSESDCI